VVPAVRRLQRARRRAASLEIVKQFGSAPASPTVSVIVPLYRRIDLIEHQMTQFADDPSMRSVDLVYVLDSPELKDELISGVARRLFPLYRQPFRVAVVSENVGFAGANNLGASIARGRLLMLLNSDVFPESPGWLDAMVRFHDSLPNPGAIGPKLLYEDDTIQHAGMFFERLSDAQPWNNEHYFKGMHRDLPAARRSRPVPAVTGAALMVARDLYRKIGGLSGDYLQGDFEDSEFCLRLLDAGRQNWYFADVALYHLEASSYDSEQRRVHDGFNRWLHTHLWDQRIAALGGAGIPGATPAARPIFVEVEVDGAALVGAHSGS
jgi:GT2 family glycosyltransferase